MENFYYFFELISIILRLTSVLFAGDTVTMLNEQKVLVD